MEEARPLSARARWILRVALIIAWATGVGGTVTSCGVLAHYRGPRPHTATAVAPAASTSMSASASASASIAISASASESVTAPASVIAPAPSSSAPAAARPSLAVSEAEADVFVESFERFRKTKLPLTAANFLLSIALVIGAARTIGRRPGGRAWLQQVCLATALYAVAEYAVSREERAFLMDRLPAAGAARVQQPGLSREQAEAAIRLNVRIYSVLRLLGQLALYGGLAIALGRRSVALELTTEPGGPRSLPPSSSDDEES
jgi:hypothetical protein